MDDFLDFTEARYRELLLEATIRYEFMDFSDLAGNDRECIWRHDVDMSPHRAVRLAEIEQSVGVRAHYFIMLGSRFYNPFESGVLAVLKRLSVMGHGVGLHFDSASVPLSRNSGCIEEMLSNQANILSSILEIPINSFTLHNPTVGRVKNINAVRYGGLVNASAPELVSSFTYCSDSNGIWRHRSLIEVVQDPSVRRLYALTHPEWWVPSPMRPRERIQRCIDGRAACVGREYDEDLARFGRPNQ